MFDVAIVGLGPVGSMATLLLSRLGLKVACVEKETGVYALPRAVIWDAELTRALQPYGLAEELSALLQPMRDDERFGFVDAQRNWLFGWEQPRKGPNGWQPSSMFDQPELESFLRKQALASELVESYLGYTMNSFEDLGDRVALEVEMDGAKTRIESRYLIACDGARSGIRKSLGISWEDLGYNQDWLVVDIKTLPGHTLDNVTKQVCDPERIATYVCTKDPYRRWEFKLNPGESWEQMLEPDTLTALIESWTPAGTYEVRRAAMYQFHAAVASKWREGNVLLAGDAAHQTPPFLGQGMNMGLRDAVNLSWKLKLIFDGKADDTLLDTYESERRPRAMDTVDWAVSVGLLMEHVADALKQAQERGEPLSISDVMQNSGYGQGRDFAPLGEGIVLSEQIGAKSSTGRIFEQPTVKHDDRNTRLDELLGPGFSLVFADDGDAQLSDQSRELLAKLDASVVSLKELEVLDGRFDRAFKGSPAVLVRPDRYVFGYVRDDLDVNALVGALGDKLGLAA